MITNITSVYGRCPNVIKTAFFNACVVLHTKCEMIGKTYKNTDNATRHTHQRRMRITANSVVFCELGQFTRNYTQTTKRGLLTTNKG